MNTNLTQQEKITLIVMLDEKIKEWAKLVHDFPAMHEFFSVKELITIKNKLQDGGN